MPDQPMNGSPPMSTYLRWLRALGIAVFAIATIIALTLLSRQQVSTVQRFWMIVGWLIACGAVVMSYVAAVRQRGSVARVVPAIVIFDAVCFLTGGLIVVSFYSSSSPFTWAVAMMWSFACLALGAITGFLFGIPRSRSRGQVPLARSGGPGTGGADASAADANAPDAQPNSAIQQGDESPIEQISDWLTKIIVGLGLANLKDLPAQMDRWASFVAAGTSVPGVTLAAGTSFCLGLIIYFLILGFLSCYILTQMFLLAFINRVRAG